MIMPTQYSSTKSTYKRGEGIQTMERIIRTGRTIAATFLALVVLAAPVGAAPTRAPGDLDPTFGKEGLVTTELSSELDQINAIAVQADGKIVAGGDSWDQKDSSPRFTLVRYNADGKLDTKFGKSGIVKTRINDKDWDAATINAMVLQPFVNYNLPAGWYLTTSPILTANWKADKAGDVWTVPLGGGVGKLFRVGTQPINVQLAAYGNVAKPEFGPDWQLRFQVQFLFPK